jgi:hypothetical protein
MSINVAPISTPASPPPPPPHSRQEKPASSPTTAGDKVELSAAAQIVLTPAENMMKETDSHAQLVKDATNGDAQARSVLAAEAAVTGITG